jgi:demethylmenaquinone methyltransferase/2-methoxy-6-polyprenyl-1,4-benzoquinol methylase
VLRPGGRAVILEFTTPRSRVVSKMYAFYFRRIMPRLARAISRDKTGAYDYLPESVASFLDAPSMARALRGAGFDAVEFRPLTFGIVTLYLARKADAHPGSTS